MDHSKSASDVRLLAVKRKLEELLKYVTAAQSKDKRKSGGGTLEEQNLEKIDKLSREAEMLLEGLGLTMEDADDLLDDTYSSLLSEYSSQMSKDAGIEEFMPEGLEDHMDSKDEATD